MLLINARHDNTWSVIKAYCYEDLLVDRQSVSIFDTLQLLQLLYFACACRTCRTMYKVTLKSSGHASETAQLDQ